MLGTLPGVIAYGVLQVFTNQTRIVGEARTVTVPSVVGVVTMLAGLLVGTHYWGAVGAAAASSLGAVTALVTVYLTWRLRPVAAADVETA